MSANPPITSELAGDQSGRLMSRHESDCPTMMLIDTSVLERLRGQVVVLAKRYASDVSDLQGRMASVKEEADRRMALVIAYRERAKIYAELSRLRWWDRKRRRELEKLLEFDSL